MHLSAAIEYPARNPGFWPIFKNPKPGFLCGKNPGFRVLWKRRFSGKLTLFSGQINGFSQKSSFQIDKIEAEVLITQARKRKYNHDSQTLVFFKKLLRPFSRFYYFFWDKFVSNWGRLANFLSHKIDQLLIFYEKFMLKLNEIWNFTTYEKPETRPGYPGFSFSKTRNPGFRKTRVFANPSHFSAALVLVAKRRKRELLEY